MLSKSYHFSIKILILLSLFISMMFQLTGDSDGPNTGDPGTTTCGHFVNQLSPG